MTDEAEFNELDDQDVFADEPTEEVSAATEEEFDGAKEAGAKQDEGTEPPNDTQNTEGSEASSEEAEQEKMVPESRIRAAVKDASSRADKLQADLDAANQRIAELSVQEAPDKDEDPDGYAQFMRIETSKAIMRDAYPDYDDKIRHFIALEQENPALSRVVAESTNPAKMAYDIAKRDLEINQVLEVKSSDKWKRFEAWEKAEAEAEAKRQAEAAQGKNKSVSQQLSQGASVVPNTNRATDVSTQLNVSTQDDDELFNGAL